MSNLLVKYKGMKNAWKSERSSVVRCTTFLLQFAVLFILLFLLNACSNTKYLAEDEKLYTYTWFDEDGLGKVNLKPLKAYELYKAGNAKTNSPVFFLPRTNLAIYNYWDNDKEKGLVHYFHEKLGKPPVLLSSVNPDFRIKVMEQRLNDMGHFDSNVTYDLKYHGKDKKKVSARYHILFKTAYTFNELNFVQKSTNVDSIIVDALSQSLIKKNEDYWLNVMEQERARLSNTLKNQGYYYFNPNFFMFHADTAVGNKQVDLTMVLKDNVPERAFDKYYIRKVNLQMAPVNPSVTQKLSVDSSLVDGISYKALGNPFKPKRVTKAISVKPGNAYTVNDHLNTIRYLQGMGAFRSVELTYNQADSISGLLDATLRLTPQKPITTKLEVNFATKSNDFMGPAAIASVGHSNIFKGGEKLVLQLDGGFEWQRGSKRKEYELGFNSYELGSQLKLSFPRFLVPFSVKNESKRYVPYTNASIGFRTQKRVRYYTMNLSQVKYDYMWKNTPQREFKLEPLAIDYLRLTQTSAEFDDFLTQYPQVALSFAEQFILGSTFSYTYTNHTDKHQLNQFYYNGYIDIAGNILNAAYTLLGDKGAGTTDPSTLFGVPFAQYSKITNDVRYYHVFTEHKQIAMRLLAGIGVPYGNATVLPYVKQYFAGGSQDIRAFYARSIGPGSYKPENTAAGSYFLDQSGEIKLMANLEYRFPITYMVNGAFFADAGNVWLINEDPSRPGGKFEFNKFMDDMAVGAGFGLRVDITYFILRLDAAVPVRKPYPVDRGQWIFSNPGFFKDFILSLAVGYPF